MTVIWLFVLRLRNLTVGSLEIVNFFMLSDFSSFFGHVKIRDPQSLVSPLQHPLDHFFFDQREHWPARISLWRGRTVSEVENINQSINQLIKTMGTYFSYLCKQDLGTFSFWANFAIDHFHFAYRSITRFAFRGVWMIINISIKVGLQNQAIY